MNEIQINSIADLVATFGDHAKRTWSYHGVGDARRELRPVIGSFGLERDRERYLFGRWEAEARAIQMLPASEWDRLVLAHTYGLPTRLLSWFDNALVAAFYACQGPDVDGAIYVLAVEQVDESQFVSPFEYPRLARYIPSSHSRRADLGLSFTVHPDPRQHIEVSREFPPGIMRVLVPAGAKASILQELGSFGVDSYLLLPDLGGLASQLTLALHPGVNRHEGDFLPFSNHLKTGMVVWDSSQVLPLHFRTELTKVFQADRAPSAARPPFDILDWPPLGKPAKARSTELRDEQGLDAALRAARVEIAGLGEVVDEAGKAITRLEAKVDDVARLVRSKHALLERLQD